MTKYDVFLPLVIGDWFSPNTYGANFKVVPDQAGVYCFEDIMSREILYVGSTKNLRKRQKGHEVKRMLNRTYKHIAFNFIPTDDYKKIEVSLIKKLRPKYNYQHNG